MKKQKVEKKKMKKQKVEKKKMKIKMIMKMKMKMKMKMMIKALKGYWPDNDYGDKELKSKYFKIELADMSNKIDEKLFEQIFGHTLIKLVDKLINTSNKEENEIIVKNINKNKDKIYEQEKDDWVIQPSD